MYKHTRLTNDVRFQQFLNERTQPFDYQYPGMTYLTRPFNRGDLFSWVVEGESFQFLDLLLSYFERFTTARFSAFLHHSSRDPREGIITGNVYASGRQIYLPHYSVRARSMPSARTRCRLGCVGLPGLQGWVSDTGHRLD